MKRIFDFSISLSLLLLLSPVLFLSAFLVWFQDFSNPLYLPQRAGLDGKPFTMYKVRSMVVNADSSGVDSTSNSDSRITPVGHLIRRFKIDELFQLFNVIKGDMSLVGPRPNVLREVSLYTSQEAALLSVKPGITDIASIVFSDEGSILSGSCDPDLDYHQLIRPRKSILGLYYVKNRTILLDFQLILLTILSLFSRPTTLLLLSRAIRRRNAPESIISIIRRDLPLTPMPPPGSSSVVTSRQI